MQKFALDGLRTLVLGTRDLTEQEFNDWKDAHHQAAISDHSQREERLDAVYNQIEKDLDLLGATAIEDKLQDGVPRTIANLRTAGIKIWVLTGDKQETAINIGYSCHLLSDDLVEEPFIVDGISYDEVQKQLVRHRTQIESYLTEWGNSVSNDASRPRRADSLSMLTLSDASSFNDDALDGNVLGGGPGGGGNNSNYPAFSLVINGHSLIHALNPSLELLFLGVAEHCNGNYKNYFHVRKSGYLKFLSGF